MASTLHDQLTRLADQASPPADTPAGRELWDRGVRYRRRLRAGTLAIVGTAVAALVVLAGVRTQSAGPPPEPAPADAPAGLPSRIHAPSPWLPGSDEVGPPGQTVALFETDRGGWTGTGPGVVAVSAATGDYRFLDLPGWEASEDPALSPDGRHVAYWTSGPTTGTPNTGSTDGRQPVAGLAVYDTVTGDVVEHRFPTEHGLSPDGIGWRDSSHLQARHMQWIAGDDGADIDQASANDLTFWQWDLGDPEPEAWPFGERLGVDTWGPPADGHQVVARGTRGLWLLGDGSDPPRRVGGAARLTFGGGQAISPDGTRIAGVWGNRRSPNDVVVLSRLGAGTPVANRLKRATATFAVEGWRDGEHVVATRRSEPLSDGLGMAVFSVDATSGEVEELVRLPEGWFNGVAWASDLLDAPVVDHPAPPTPLDPRWVAGLAAAAVLAAGLALRRWRRRVAP